MTNHLRVLMASSDELFEQLLRDVIEGAGHRLTIRNPWEGKQAFLDEALAGGYDVVVLTNVSIPLDYAMSLIAPLRESCSAKVIVLSGAPDRRKGSPRRGGVPFYQLPMPTDKLLEVVESAAR